MEWQTSDAAELWWLDLDALAARRPTWEALLPPDELQRAKAFAFPELQRRFLASRAGLRIILAHYLRRAPHELRLLRSAAGKPYVEQGGLEFNLSHSGPLGLVAVTPGQRGCVPVGVDLEQLRPDLDWQGISRQVFHPLEQAAVAVGGSRTFFTVWTRKEAWLKAMGTGWTEQAKQFSIVTADWTAEQNESPLLLAGRHNCWVQGIPQPAGCSGNWAAALCQSEFNLPICSRTAEELGCLCDRWC